MLTDQNYATVEAALTAGTMPTDSRSIVIDYNVVKKNEDMGVGSMVEISFGEGQPWLVFLFGVINLINTTLSNQIARKQERGQDYGKAI